LQTSLQHKLQKLSALEPDLQLAFEQAEVFSLQYLSSFPFCYPSAAFLFP
jgi:hypothetical protein